MTFHRVEFQVIDSRWRMRYNRLGKSKHYLKLLSFLDTEKIIVLGSLITKMIVPSVIFFFHNNSREKNNILHEIKIGDYNYYNIIK